MARRRTYRAISQVDPKALEEFQSGIRKRYSDDEILRHGVKSANTVFVQKPFSVEALAEKVRETLNTPIKVPSRA